ncbi:V-type ATP synthase subunit E [Blautia liquoris]|jgi:V/A-type H+-transporting ATPase subunit E|uniref:V-type ATP synthase subunit E n=1 Tax=Blautia liquoris TaxID=2779518 RepID=A0A7M2RIW4_9FIRM|nr:V-type ATP synthase subunit E [Blautia liquoris]QOV20273.1 V-type ATP synthase subunit E [Blautia liquoris]
MNGLEKITEQILDEAREETDQILDKAEKEKTKILAKSKKECDQRKREFIASMEKELQDYSDREASVREQRFNRAVLQEKQLIIEEMIDKAYHQMKNQETGIYFKTLERLFERYCHSEEGQMILNIHDLERMPGDFRYSIEQLAGKKGGSLTISDVPGQISDGFLLIYGKVEENCTFQSIIEAKKDCLKDQVNKILWEESDG